MCKVQAPIAFIYLEQQLFHSFNSLRSTLFSSIIPFLYLFLSQQLHKLIMEARAYLKCFAPRKAKIPQRMNSRSIQNKNDTVILPYQRGKMIIFKFSIGNCCYVIIFWALAQSFKPFLR